MFVQTLRWFESTLGISVTSGSAWGITKGKADPAPLPDDSVVVDSPDELRAAYEERGLQWQEQRSSRCGMTCTVVKDLSETRGLVACRFAMDEPPEWFPASVIRKLAEKPAPGLEGYEADREVDPTSRPGRVDGATVGEEESPPGSAVHSDQPAAQAPPKAAEEHEAGGSLPPGWESALDPTSGRSYWFHRESGEVTWNQPSAAPAPPPAPPPEPEATAALVDPFAVTRHDPSPGGDPAGVVDPFAVVPGVDGDPTNHGAEQHQPGRSPLSPVVDDPRATTAVVQGETAAPGQARAEEEKASGDSTVARTAGPAPVGADPFGEEEGPATGADPLAVQSGGDGRQHS
eukprot:Hpha_TRINITY_DN8819_c0_g1::TRINITY_DN8819_c0_g1_i1::g.141483::m.141483